MAKTAMAERICITDAVPKPNNIKIPHHGHNTKHENKATTRNILGC